MNTPITLDTDLRPLISTDDPEVYTNIHAIIDFFHVQVKKATEAYPYKNFLELQKVYDEENSHYLRLIVSGLEEEKFNLDLNLVEEDGFCPFISLENSDYSDEESYSYMIGVREMVKSIFADRCDHFSADDSCVPGTYFILSCDVNKVLDNFIRAMQMVEVHLNLVREAEEEEEE